LTVGILLALYDHFVTHSARTHHRHYGGDRGITKKCKNHEAPRSTRKVVVTRQYAKVQWRLVCRHYGTPYFHDIFRFLISLLFYFDI